MAASDKKSSIPEDEIWSDRELDIIKEHKEYHQEMITFINNLEKNRKFPPPKKPSSSLSIPSKSSTLLGKKLHLYLKRKIF